jgi:hypothetical protein
LPRIRQDGAKEQRARPLAELDRLSVVLDRAASIPRSSCGIGAGDTSVAPGASHLEVTERGHVVLGDACSVPIEGAQEAASTPGPLAFLAALLGERLGAREILGDALPVKVHRGEVVTGDRPPPFAGSGIEAEDERIVLRHAVLAVGGHAQIRAGRESAGIARLLKEGHSLGDVLGHSVPLEKGQPERVAGLLASAVAALLKERACAYEVLLHVQAQLVHLAEPETALGVATAALCRAVLDVGSFAFVRRN